MSSAIHSFERTTNACGALCRLSAPYSGHVDFGTASESASGIQLTFATGTFPTVIVDVSDNSGPTGINYLDFGTGAVTGIFNPGEFQTK
jgi:hypothetical protein